MKIAGGDRHRPRRPHLPRRDRRARARHPRGGRRRRRDDEAARPAQMVTVSCAEGESAASTRARCRSRSTRIDRQRLPRPRTADHGQSRQPRPRLPDRDAAATTASGSRAWSSSSASTSASTRWRSLIPEQDRRRPRRGRRSPGWRSGYRDARPTSSSSGWPKASAPSPRRSIRKPVIVRLSDFKTNEYASLLGGAAFEPKEENPMLGFRGASRYAHPAYAEGFALECAALRRVRDEMGLTNCKLMVPFCRRVDGRPSGCSRRWPATG